MLCMSSKDSQEYLIKTTKMNCEGYLRGFELINENIFKLLYLKREHLENQKLDLDDDVRSSNIRSDIVVRYILSNLL